MAEHSSVEYADRPVMAKVATEDAVGATDGLLVGLVVGAIEGDQVGEVVGEEVGAAVHVL